MARRDLSTDERARLLNDLTTLKSDDDDATAQDPKWFLPLDSHARAVRHDTLIVRGGRGTGKSALFHFLAQLQDHQELLGTWGENQVDPTIVWLSGFDRGVDYPSEAVVGEFARSEAVDDSARRSFWFGWLCWRLSKGLKRSLPPGALAQLAEQSGVPTPGRIAEAGRAQLTELSDWLDAVERTARPIVVTYDRLDRIGGTWAGAQRMATSLLGMWLAFTDRYRYLRAKVFVRDDLYQTALSAFPDASKLDARSVSIDWRVEDIYRVLLKHMGNLSKELRDWTETGARALHFSYKDALGYLPPASLPETGSRSQKSFVDHLAGEQMGTGANKGFTYRWIPNHLQDAHGRVVPRSILNLIRHAAGAALERSPQARGIRLLAPGELQQSLVKTSERRVAELREEYPVVARLEALRDHEVMMSRQQAVSSLSKYLESGDEFEVDGEAALRKLIEIGAMKERMDGRVDVPDIYREGFGIKRRGGIRRAR